ncbi:MAG: hypothetical protein HZB87_00300, partial [Desulfatitalea sp.]|nr:hypothetical protein [Desulfatitalea sp.]
VARHPAPVHCAAPPCSAACPHQAIRKLENDGIVMVDASKCAGAEQFFLRL